VATIRDMVRQIQIEVRDTDLQPDRAADLLNRLTALLGNIADEQREADMAYDVLYLALYEEHGAANRARLYANVTPEYQRKREAKDTQEQAKQLTITLRQFLRTTSDEMRLAR
jgi:hypothetical protein